MWLAWLINFFSVHLHVKVTWLNAIIAQIMADNDLLVNFDSLNGLWKSSWMVVIPSFFLDGNM